MRAKLRMIKQEMWRRMHQPIPIQGKWLWYVVNGYSTTTQCRPMSGHWPCSDTMSSTSGGVRCGGAAAEGSDHVGTDDAAGGRLASETDHPSFLAERSLCRHTPEVGAVCGKAARTVLCGGARSNSRPYRVVPKRLLRCKLTATARTASGHFRSSPPAASSPVMSAVPPIATEFCAA